MSANKYFTQKLDSEDLDKIRKAFFSSQPKDKPSSVKRKKKNKIFRKSNFKLVFSMFVIGFATGLMTHINRIPKAAFDTKIIQDPSSYENLNISNIYYYAYPNFKKKISRKIPLLILFPSQTIVLDINLKKELDFDEKNIFLTIKNPKTDLVIKTVLRDKYYHSNSLNPYLAKLSLKKNKLDSLDILLNNKISNDVLGKINNIKLYITNKGNVEIPFLIKKIYIAKIKQGG